MNNKKIIIPIIVFVVVLFIFIIGYSIISSHKYSCIDYETNEKYTFNNEKDMHKVCDQFNGLNDDKIIKKYNIYKDLINNNDNSFSFYPYVNNDKLAIIITITDCYNPGLAKERAISWFKNHNYDINQYQIDYEYPCEH